MTADGRTYTAVSRVPPAAGFPMQTLVAAGTPIAWLFARPLGRAKNGFALTGGTMNYTGEVQFLESGHSATIKMNFKVSRYMCQIVLNCLFC